MKQLLLRVDDELHAELTHLAKLRETTVNALAGGILNQALKGEAGSRKNRLLTRLVALGEIRARAGVGEHLSAAHDEDAENLTMEERVSPEVKRIMADQRGD